MELYCVKSHSQGMVKAGNIYPLINDKCPCRCNAIDVGIVLLEDINGIPLSIGDNGTCSDCGCTYKFDGVFWVCRSLFANIDNINIEQAIECINELQLTLTQLT